MEVLGACGVHHETPAALACARCGAYACALCAPAPTLLCAVCQSRRPQRHPEWEQAPSPPGTLRRWGTSIPALYGAFGVLALSARWAQSASSLSAIVAVALVVMLLGASRVLGTLAARPGRRILGVGLSLMRQQRNREAAVVFEEAARFERLDAPSRALALWLFGACASSMGHHERALSVLEPLTPSAWRHYRTLRLLRGPGQIVLAVTRALAGDEAGAERARADYQPTLLHRFTYSPAYGDALLALRRGSVDDAVRLALDQSLRHGHRVGDQPLLRSTALLDAYYRAMRGEDEGAIEGALLPARLSPLEAHLGLARHWPSLSSFIERRLGPG